MSLNGNFARIRELLRRTEPDRERIAYRRAMYDLAEERKKQIMREHPALYGPIDESEPTSPR